MKFNIIVIAIIILSLTACGGRSTKNQDAHTHGEGCTHENQATTEQEIPAQESFKVEADTTIVVTDTVKSKPHTHSHNGKTHSH